MKFPFTIRARTAVGLLAVLAVVGSVAAETQRVKSTVDLTAAEIDERLQVRILSFRKEERSYFRGYSSN